MGPLPTPHPDPVPEFEAVRAVVRRTLQDHAAWTARPEAEQHRDEVRRELARAAAFFARRDFAGAQRRLGSRDPLANWAGGAFLAFRDRSAMIDYLRFQECAYPQPDGSDPLGWLADGIREELVPLGRHPRTAVRLRVRCNPSHTLRLDLRLDPFANHRSIYTRHLRNARAGRRRPTRHALADATDLLAARAKLAALKAGALIAARGWVALDAPRALREALISIFPAAAALSQTEFDQIESSLERYGTERAESLIEAFPQSVIDSGGCAKLLKLAIGTLIGRANAMRGSDAPAPFIIDSIKIAYCWALTYPLVDDVLDAAGTSPETRAALRDTFRAVASGHAPKPAASPTAPAISELGARMHELLHLMEPAHRTRAAAAIWNVFRAHAEDSTPRLGSHLTPATSPLETALTKSLLVRIATMEVCGLPAAQDDYTSMAAVALFNQLGDDIWDAEEDLAEQRLTPVTHHLTGGSPDAYTLYLDLAAFLAYREPPGAARAAALAVCHTFKLANDVGSRRSRGELTRALTEFAPDADAPTILSCTPHIDPDSLLFDLEAAVRPFTLRLYGAASRAWQRSVVREARAARRVTPPSLSWR